MSFVSERDDEWNTVFVKALMIVLETALFVVDKLLDGCYSSVIDTHLSSPCRLAALYSVPGASSIWPVLFVNVGRLSRCSS